MSKCILLSCSFGCWLAMSVSGPANASELVLDRQAAVGYTLAHNPAVRAAAQQLQSARTHLTMANALPNPLLGVAVSGYNPTNQAGESVNVQLTQTLLFVGPRRAKSELAREDARFAEFAYAQIRQSAINTTKKAYNQVLAARFLLGVATDNVAWSGTLKAAADAKLKLGEVGVSEEFRARVALAQARQDLAAAQNDHQIALEHLRVAIGHMAPLEVVQAGPYESPLVSLPPPAVLVARGLAARPELGSLNSNVHHEQLTEQWLHASVLPSMDVFAGAGPNGGVPGVNAGLNLALPVWYRQEGELAQTRANQVGLAYQRQALENDVQGQIEEACAQINLLESQIQLYQAQLLPCAKELVNQTRERYLAGDASGYELLDTRRGYRQALVAYGQSYLAYRNALADLETALGTELPFTKE